MKLLTASWLVCVLLVFGILDTTIPYADAQTETNLYSFAALPTDGQVPYAGLVQGSDGNFYGTTYTGGSNYNGTVFRIGPSGSYTSLYVFVGSPTDGNGPSAGLVQGCDGNFYGTTRKGGASTNCSGGCGTVFRIGPTGSYTNLYSFAGYPNDGSGPWAGLIQGSDGNLYGTTQNGGTSTNCGGGCGTVFRISPSGSYTNFYSFGSTSNDGEQPEGALVQSSNGDFYGTTYEGGTNHNGTVFRISPSGSETNLHFFGGFPNDGIHPVAGLVQGSDGNFYGTTFAGGTNSAGTVFRISPTGSETNLYSFSNNPDGASPYAGLTQGSDGNFYGTTYVGGIGYGTVFRISPGGNYEKIYYFAGYPINDGAYPVAGLIQGNDGDFYGTVSLDGANGEGTVYRLSVPLNPPPFPINQITGVQLSGKNIVFNVVSIAHETYQLQFSGSMTPTNWINVPGVSVTNSTGALLTLTNFGGAQGFYRFRVTP